MSARPTAGSRIVAGISGGLFGGGMVGVSEALIVLSATRPAEYQALVYGYLLYGLLGALAGLAAGLVLASIAPWFPLANGRAWALTFFGVAGGCGFAIVSATLDARVFFHQGLPASTTLALSGAFVGVSVVGVWLVGNLLTKTPLRAVTGRGGTLVTWLCTAGLTWLFSLAPAPGAGADVPSRPPQPPDFAQKPDVVVILVDALRADALSPARAPHLAAFARDAVTFEQHVTSSSSTRASVASLFTSMWPSLHGCKAEHALLPDAVVTFAEQLRDGGYATVGFPNDVGVTGAQGFDQGFDAYPFTPDFPLGASASSHALALYGAAREAWRAVGGEATDRYTPAEVLLARAVATLDARPGERFLFYVHLVEPAEAFAASPSVDEALLRDRYAVAVTRVDLQIGAFLDRLRAAGRYDEAVIVVTSDHGEELGEHGGIGDGATLYDEVVHVPLLVKLPGNTYAGARVPWQVRQIDVAPTLAAVAGVDPAPAWQGVDLFADRFDADLALTLPPPWLDAEDPPFVAPTWAEHPGSRDAVSELDRAGVDLRSLRSGGGKLVEALRVPRGNPRQLPPRSCYDLLSDAREAKNLAGQGAGCEEALAGRLGMLLDPAVR